MYQNAGHSVMLHSMAHLLMRLLLMSSVQIWLSCSLIAGLRMGCQQAGGSTTPVVAQPDSAFIRALRDRPAADRARRVVADAVLTACLL
jgi:hypothetical protein